MAKTSTTTTSTSTSSSSTVQSIKDKTFTCLGQLIKLLPTGTVFLFQFLNPVLTNNGSCQVINKYLTAALIGVCGLSCFFSTFTDSYKGSDGNIHYGIATAKGIWPSTAAGSVDLSAYKLRLGDFVHAFFALIVFSVVSLLDSNTVNCFYPSLESTEMVLPPALGTVASSVFVMYSYSSYGIVLLQVLPPVIGAVASSVFATYPYTRHGIGYPSTQSSTSS